MIHDLRIFFKNVIDPASICKNPEISVAIPVGVNIVCLNDDSVDIQIDDSITGPYCLSFIARCSNTCQTCKDVVVEKCFCINSQDCTGCSTCKNYICVSRCDAGQVCDNETCGDCGPGKPCPCNQNCVQGKCQCTAEKPIKRGDDCCVQCIEGQTPLEPCTACVDGMIVPKNCPGQVCDPTDNECKDCTNNGHCSARPNECCDNGKCKCCLGFVRNPNTGFCEPQSPCTSQAECEVKYGPCFTCEPTGCAPKKCPPGQVPVVVNGICRCVQACSPDTPCPPGEGCINGGCVPCAQLDCTGVAGLQCQFAIGCKCQGNVCTGIDCNPANVTLAWQETPPVPGQIVPGSEQPALAGTANIEAIGIVHNQPPAGSSYQNHRFTLAITNGTSGSWTLKNTPSSSISLGSGTSVTFDLTATGPNLVLFVVEFVETGTGRKASWAFFREITAPLIAPNVWSYEFDSTGIAPKMTGGSQGSVKLCANNANFQAVGVTNVSTTDTLQITFFPDPINKNCLIAHVTGCGLWNGDMILNCGGQTFTVPAPEFFRDPANCCDPTKDPNCGGDGFGSPCATIAIQPIDLIILPTYGTNVSGDGEFMAVADWASAGLTALQMFYLNPSPGCWSASVNPESSSSDLSVVTSPTQSPFGPSVSALAAFFTFGDGGCIRFGHTCELRVPGCKKLQGEECFTECDLFNVSIVQTGPNTYTAVPTMNDEVVTYLWNYPGLVNNSTQTVTITPQGGASVLTVTAFYGTAPVKCDKTAVLQLSTTIPGCTNGSACNFNAAANVDDGSCVFIAAGTYDCVLGYQAGAVTVGTGTFGGVVVRKIGSTAIATNNKLAPGTYTVDVYVNGVKYCSHPLVVPQCYKCNIAGDCIPAPANNNQGNYTTPDCDGVNCVCSIEIDIAQRACSNGQAAMYVTATGDTGSYVVVIDRVDNGSQVLAGTTFTSVLGVHSPVLCPGIYRVTVTGKNCAASRDFQISCNTCTGSTLDLTSVSHDCALSQLTFTIVGAPCSTNYNVQLLSSTQQVLSPAVSQNYTTAGIKNLVIGVRPAGNYILRLTDNNGCVINEPITICPDDLAPCGITSANLANVLGSGGAYITFTGTVVLGSNDGTYSVRLFEVGPGSCPGTWVPPLSGWIAQEFISGSGSHTVNFVDAVPTPGVNTCYAIEVQKTTDSTCDAVALTTVFLSSPPAVCSGSVTNVSYDPLTGKPVVSWDFQNTSGSLTVQIQTGAGPSCNPGDTVVVTSTGNGEDGTNIQFGPIPQESAGQFICVTIWDEANPTCKASMTATIPACSCGIEIISHEVHPADQEVEVTFRAKCTSGLTDIFVVGTGSADGQLVNQVTTENGLWVEYTKVVSLGGYPANGGSGTLEVTDQANGACTHTIDIVLPPNCQSCAQVASAYLNDSVVTAVKNFAGVQVVAGTYTLPGDTTDLATDLYQELIDDGANFCAGASDVHVSASRDAGMRVNQDSTDFQSLDHVVITHADFASALKSYFANCGCTGITRKCDYQAVLPISASADTIILRFATNNAAGDYTGTVSIDIDVPQTFSSADEAAIAAAIESALTSTSCGSVVDAVNVSFAANNLTIDILQTNAGLGLILTLESGGVGDVVDFAQSNCS